MNVSQNQVLANVFAKALISNTSASRYARLSFVDLVSATVLTKTFQKAIKSANTLFGIEDENKVIHRRLTKKAAKITKHAAKKHAKKQHSKIVVSDGTGDAPIAIVKTAGKRGRPKGSKNKPKSISAQSMPIEDPIDLIDLDLTEPVESYEDTPLNEL